MKKVQRNAYNSLINQSLQRSPVTALLGPRQCGKTTLARAIADELGGTFLDLESLPVQQRLQNPELVLRELTGLVVLDEIQIMPELFSVLRVLADRIDSSTRFLVLGSASPELMKGATESLAGRVEFIELSGFNLGEVGNSSWKKLWLRGGFPRSFLAASDADSIHWREGFIRTFLERDLPQLGIMIPAPAMRRFWTMMAHYHGQTWNGSDLARSLGLSDKTIRRYLDILTQSFMLRQIQPWFENISKRQVKAPKVFFRDTGLLHSLFTITNEVQLLEHPRIGASWEGFAMNEVLCIAGITDPYFWATQAGTELDLFFMHNGKRYGVEFKFNEAPRISRSMQIALNDLKLDHLWVVYPGQETFPMADSITATGIDGYKNEWQRACAQ